MLKIKRVYDDVSEQDGKRILVDGVWPRGIKKEDLQHDEWYKDIAPSTDLRKWFDHDPDKWEAFKKKYKKELKEHQYLVDDIKKASDGHKDRKSTRLNSSHVSISYAVFCLKKKNT